MLLLHLPFLILRRDRENAVGVDRVDGILSRRETVKTLVLVTAVVNMEDTAATNRLLPTTRRGGDGPAVVGRRACGRDMGSRRRRSVPSGAAGVSVVGRRVRVGLSCSGFATVVVTEAFGSSLRDFTAWLDTGRFEIGFSVALGPWTLAGFEFEGVKGSVEGRRVFSSARHGFRRLKSFAFAPHCIRRTCLVSALRSAEGSQENRSKDHWKSSILLRMRNRHDTTRFDELEVTRMVQTANNGQ